MDRTFKGIRHYIDILSEALQVQAPWDDNTQTVTYNGKQYTWDSQAQPSGQGTVVSTSSQAVGSRNMGPSNVELNANGTYTKTDAPATAPAGSGSPMAGIKPTAPTQPATAPTQPATAPAQPAPAPAGSGSPMAGIKPTAPAPEVAPAPAAPAQPAPASAAPINRDSMTFGQAFADARAKGEKQFNWKGKPYAVKLAPAKAKPAQAGMAKPVEPGLGQTMDGMDTMGAPGTYGESKGYNELERIVSLVHHR